MNEKFDYQEIKKEILELAEVDYQKFNQRLLPGIPGILGVRLPNLRKIAKKIARGNWEGYLKDAKTDSFEEIMLQGMVIGYIKADITIIQQLISEFVPEIQNWSVCDSFCIGLKCTKNYLNEMWDFIQPYLQDSREFHARFGIVMIIDFFITEIYIEEILSILDSVKNEAYYVKMAIAWAISMCYVKFPEQTYYYLKNNSLDLFTYNKTLQKIIESNCVEHENKIMMQKMKRREE